MLPNLLNTIRKLNNIPLSTSLFLISFKKDLVEQEFKMLKIFSNLFVLFLG